ncbi:MAG: hypothetical protein LUF27_13780 [Lachnospiraceae bacterium]|nr:hypothetical protein [Lachnospiraceae bacterium]
MINNRTFYTEHQLKRLVLFDAQGGQKKTCYERRGMVKYFETKGQTEVGMEELIYEKICYSCIVLAIAILCRIVIANATLKGI